MRAELRLALLGAALAFPHAEAADGPVATLAEARGSVLVSRDATISAAREAQRLLPGTRVLTPARAGAVIAFDGGCRIALGAGERFVVPAQPPCGVADRGSAVPRLVRAAPR